jgi:hypothetical protein
VGRHGLRRASRRSWSSSHIHSGRGGWDRRGGHGHRRRAGLGVLDVEREVELGAELLEQVGERRDVRGEVGSVHLGDRTPTQAAAHHAIVVEHGDAVAGEPDVALESRGAEPDGQTEGLDGVLAGVGACAPVGEGDGPGQVRGETRAHHAIVADPWARPAGRLKNGRVEPIDPDRNRGGECMATIRASCADCGDVELTSADVTVRVCSANSAGSYSFTCPTCGRIVVKSAEPRIVELLVTSGCGS